MKREDAELFYDGRIPTGAITPEPHVIRSPEEEGRVAQRIAEAQAAMQAKAMSDAQVEALAVLKGHAEGKTMVPVSTSTRYLSVNALSVYRAGQVIDAYNHSKGQER